MTVLEQAIDLIGRLTRGEKARLVRDIVSQLDDSFPGIDSRPDVCGGEPCIVRTRIPVWLLVQSRRLGASEAELLHAYPTLRAQCVATELPLGARRRPRRRGACDPAR
jgi:uncharacterized protein (DUF433 family)